MLLDEPNFNSPDGVKSDDEWALPVGIMICLVMYCAICFTIVIKQCISFKARLEEEEAIAEANNEECDLIVVMGSQADEAAADFV